MTCCLVVCPQWEISGFGAGVCSVALVGPVPTSSHGALGESTESCRLALSPPQHGEAAARLPRTLGSGEQLQHGQLAREQRSSVWEAWDLLEMSIQLPGSAAERMISCQEQSRKLLPFQHCGSWGGRKLL